MVTIYVDDNMVKQLRLSVMDRIDMYKKEIDGEKGMLEDYLVKIQQTADYEVEQRNGMRATNDTIRKNLLQIDETMGILYQLIGMIDEAERLAKEGYHEQD